MKLRNLPLLALAPLLCGLAAAAPAPQARRAAPETPRQQRAAPERGGEEAEVLARAARVLAARGFEAEARRLREILGDMVGVERSDGIEARAEALGRADVDELTTRVAILELAAAGFEAEGWESNAQAIRWLAAVGRRQLDGGEGADLPPMAPGLEDREGPLMESLVEILEEGVELQRKAERPRLARLQNRLARFYRERDGMPPRAGGERPAPRGDDRPAPRERDLTYIEGRAPVLALAREAFRRDGLDMDPAELERARAWMDWMTDHARRRVAVNAGRDVAGEPRPMPGAVDMDELIAMVRRAGEIHARAGAEGKAKRCFDLAEYYTRRQAGDAPDNSASSMIAAPVAVEEEPAEEPAATDRRGAEERVRRRAELEARRARLEAEIAHVRARLREAQAELERIRASGGR